MRSRATLIDALVAETPPPSRYRSPAALGLAWLVVTWAFVVTATLLVAPMRPGFLEQLLSSGHFALESFVGLSAGVLGIRAGVGLAFPYPAPGRRGIAAAVGLFALWAGMHVYALWNPALEPSMLGKRDFCVFETLVYGTPPMLAGLWILRRRAASRRLWTGALVGGAAGAVPGLLMQLACMYVPEHILVFHLAPVAVLAACGAALGPLLLRRF